MLSQPTKTALSGPRVVRVEEPDRIAAPRPRTGLAWVVRGQVALADSARGRVVVSVVRAFAPADQPVPAVLLAAAMIVAPGPTTSERAVALMALAAARRPAAMRRSSRGARRT